jgi:hypothetical protein
VVFVRSGSSVRGRAEGSLTQGGVFDPRSGAKATFSAGHFARSNPSNQPELPHERAWVRGWDGVVAQLSAVDSWLAVHRISGRTEPEEGFAFQVAKQRPGLQRPTPSPTQ